MHLLRQILLCNFYCNLADTFLVLIYQDGQSGSKIKHVTISLISYKKKCMYWLFLFLAIVFVLLLSSENTLVTVSFLKIYTSQSRPNTLD